MAGRIAMQRVYDKGNRFYQLLDSGLKMPSVTSVLGGLDKGGLTDWAVAQSVNTFHSDVKAQLRTEEGVTPAWLHGAAEKAKGQPNALRDAAAEFGTAAHNAMDAIVRGEPVPEVTPAVQKVVDGFRRWLEGSGLTLDPRGDTVVYSQTYQYAGALDALATDAEGRVHILDFKTSNSVHASYALQLAAYTHAFAEMYGGGEMEPPPGARPLPPSAAQDHISCITAHAPGGGGLPAATPLATPPSPPSPDDGEDDSDAYSQERVTRAAVQVGGTGPSQPPSRRGLGGGGMLGGLGGGLPTRHLSSTSGVPGAEGGGGLAPRPSLAVSARVVRFDKRTGQAHEHMVGDLAVSFQAFKAALYLWRVQQQQAGALLVAGAASSATPLARASAPESEGR